MQRPYVQKISDSNGKKGNRSGGSGRILQMNEASAWCFHRAGPENRHFHCRYCGHTLSIFLQKQRATIITTATTAVNPLLSKQLQVLACHQHHRLTSCCVVVGCCPF